MLIVHQNALDLFTSFFLMVTYATRLCNVHLAGSAGYWLCTLIFSECLSWWATTASAINLAIITIERYLRVVHHSWSQNKLRSWMVYSAMVAAWIISFIGNIVVVFPTSDVVDGFCYAFYFWNSRTAEVFYYTWSFLSFYVIIIFIFVFCYWRIVVVVRRQASVMAGHGADAVQDHLNQIQSNVIKLMIFVSACYAVSWLPFFILFLID